MKRLCIVGFGLIGGSFALAARERFAGLEVTAIDVPGVLALEAARAAADRLVAVGDAPAIEHALRNSTLALLAAPVRVIADRVLDVLAFAPVVTDCGSTKRHVVERAGASPRRRRFVPGHPMAGQPHGTIAGARADLFVDRNWIVCPEGSDADAVAEVTEWVGAVGARCVSMSSQAHDAAVARTSHLPQLVGSALKVITPPEVAARAAGPAFERITRAAGGSEAIWLDIFATNGDEIARALRELCAELAGVADAFERSGDTAAARDLLLRARKLVEAE